jgi:hypothetical protein
MKAVADDVTSSGFCHYALNLVSANEKGLARNAV